MIPELSIKDLNTLHNAGIHDVNSLISEAAAFVRNRPIYSLIPMPNSLSQHEEEFLQEGGAVGVGNYNQAAATHNVTVIAGEFSLMVSTALTQQAVSKKLNVSTSRIRQRIDGCTLYSVDASGGRLCPNWQFADDSTLTGLEKVLEVINCNAHPVAVQRFFLSPAADLKSESFGETMSPRDWLLTGHPVDQVVLLAKEL